MTWTKFGAEFRDECAEAGLSDAAFRTHVEAVMYLYGVEAMDMRIQRRLVRKWAGSDNYQDAVAELVAKAYWATDGTDWRVVHHEDVFRQSLAAQTLKRSKDKAYQAARRAALSAAGIGNDVGTDEANDVAATQSDRQTDRQSTKKPENPDEEIDETTGEVLTLLPLDDGVRQSDPRDPWASPSPRTMCGQCGDWVGRDREVNGQTLCAPCVRGERRAS